MQVTIMAFFFLASGVQLTTVLASGESAEVRQIEDFSRFEAGSFPEGWKYLWTQKSKARQTYAVRLGEESYLEAKTFNSDIPIAKKFAYDLKEYPFLNWQWRALKLPKGGDERYKKTGDSGAGVYVIFPGKIRPNSIKYVWSATLALGTVTESPFSNNTKIVVLRNHSTPLGKWTSEKVNVYEDYKRLFGREPEPVQGIGIMSDSNDTRSRAEAHYRAISITKK